MQGDSEQLLDEMLVLQWQDGRSEAMQSLVERWQRRLWQHARRLTGDPDGAWEVLQEAWMGMIRSIGRLDDPRQFTYWACSSRAGVFAWVFRSWAPCARRSRFWLSIVYCFSGGSGCWWFTLWRELVFQFTDQ